MSSVISLFAGCGGSSLGYQAAGCEVLASIEFDPHAAQTYRANFPQTRLYEADIATLDPLTLMTDLGLAPGELAILDGSPPCQGFSMAGKREVLDPRNRLFEEYVRFLTVLQPQALVMENVPGLVIGPMRQHFFRMLALLTAAGYTIRARILNAAHYGVPQNRKRVIVLGFRQDLGQVPQHPQPTQAAPVSVRQAWAEPLDHDLILSPTGRALKLAQALRPGDSGARLHRRYGQKGNDFSLIRLAWDAPSPTVCRTVRPGQCGLLHPEETRFLSIGELKRVCSFPDRFILEGSFEARWGRLGNAVPPRLSQAIAQAVMTQLKGDSVDAPSA